MENGILGFRLGTLGALFHFVLMLVRLIFRTAQRYDTGIVYSLCSNNKLSTF
jgi:hypothetical protein